MPHESQRMGPVPEHMTKSCDVNVHAGRRLCVRARSAPVRDNLDDGKGEGVVPGEPQALHELLCIMMLVAGITARNLVPGRWLACNARAMSLVCLLVRQ